MTANGKYVSYLRVSTDKQGRSGLGLEAQRKAVEDFLNGGGWDHLAEYIEIETGKRDDRPELQKALGHAKLTGATLVVAKLDRLSRNARFLLELQEAGTRFVCADMPDVNPLTIGVLALVAQQEREAISRRTKEALAAAKARGTKLGCPLGAAHLRQYGNTAAVAALKRAADRRAADLASVIAEIRQGGTVGYRGIARELERRGVLTPRGGRWHPTAVKRLDVRENSAAGSSG